MATREESGSNRGPVFLRSYTNDLAAPDLDLSKIKLWEAARATSAAPGYFKPIQVGRVKLVDGGLLANNPLGW
jgi:patatin-like phospholipase/acyl hydrolase